MKDLVYKWLNFIAYGALNSTSSQLLVNFKTLSPLRYQPNNIHLIKMPGMQLVLQVCIWIVVLYCIYCISAHQSEALPARETQREESS